jgi:phosphoglycerate dehydrogenase-like enzyme
MYLLGEVSDRGQKQVRHSHIMLSVELRGKTLGVIGLGRIGVRVAEIGIAFGMRVIYYSCAKRGS